MSDPNPGLALTLEHVRRALSLADFDVISAWLRMAPRSRPLTRPSDRQGRPKPASVLVLLYPLAGELALVLTRRAETLPNHQGQVSFPGGAKAPSETYQHAALRETAEELRIPVDQIALIGCLTPLYVYVSDFEIHPFVGYLPYRPPFNPNPLEVAQLIEMPLPMLLDPAVKQTERWTIRGVALDVPFYRVAGHAVWGATAAMLSELEGRLRAVLGLGWDS